MAIDYLHHLHSGTAERGEEKMIPAGVMFIVLTADNSLV
jgi:hypothetical protein